MMDQQDLSGNYTEVVITFKKNGQVKYTHGNEEVNGQWSYRNETVQELISLKYFKFTFTNNSNAMALNHEWSTIGVSPQQISGSNMYTFIRLEKLD